MEPDVTVVVPVYNPGSSVDNCVASLVAQTVKAGRFEAIFVDDGSTDGSGDRLETMAAELPWMTVVRQENSGWSGKPRNVGTDLARGSYVQYLDQDDELAPNALARMVDAARTNGTDIVAGKVTSDFRNVPHHLFSRSRDRCTIEDAPLIDSLTPHKLFRREFLHANGIRWAEGRRRLEDQLFVTQAYLAPHSTTSIVADEVCYRYLRREDNGNAGERHVDPDGYFGNLREVLDVVEARTEPGPLRDRLLARFVRVELMGRLGAGAVAAYPDDYRERMFSVISTLLHDRFPLSVDSFVPPVARAMTERARAGDLDAVTAISRAAGRIRADVTVASQAWEGHRVATEVEADFVVDGVPLLLDRVGEELALPRSLFGDAADSDSLLTGPDSDGPRVDVLIRHRASQDEWFAGPSLLGTVEETARGTRVRWHSRVEIDARTAAGGHPLRAGTHDLFLRVWAYGVRREVRLRPPTGDAGPADVVLVASGHISALHYVTRAGTLAMSVNPSPRLLRSRMPPVTLSVKGRRLVARAPVLARPSQVQLRLRRGKTERFVGGALTTNGLRASRFSVRARDMGKGRWRVALAVHLADGRPPVVLRATQRARVDFLGHIVLEERGVPGRRSVRQRSRAQLRRAVRLLKRVARRARRPNR
jgi:glycosyltransferase involved in cell wall biosynthesis